MSEQATTLSERAWRAAYSEAEALRRFRNALRILRSIDRHEFVGTGLQACDWPDFRADPIRWFIGDATEADAAKLWQLIEGRQI